MCKERRNVYGIRPYVCLSDTSFLQIHAIQIGSDKKLTKKLDSVLSGSSSHYSDFFVILRLDIYSLMEKKILQSFYLNNLHETTHFYCWNNQFSLQERLIFTIGITSFYYWNKQFSLLEQL
jgi:hypothetical protein